jgi:hypothetical protein
MPANSDDVKYSEIVVRAETAVAGVQDPELKRIAFQKVLETLLAQGEPDRRQKDAKSHSGKTATGSKTATKVRANPRGGPKAYIEELINEQFFKSPRSIAAVKSELENSGHHIAVTSLSGPLQKLCQQKKLRRKKDAEAGGFTYSNW